MLNNSQHTKRNTRKIHTSTTKKNRKIKIKPGMLSNILKNNFPLLNIRLLTRTKKMFELFSTSRNLVMANEAENDLPYYAEGKVIKGFGRGSKHLGFPTANFDEDVVAKMPSTMDNGVYFGWANVDKGPVYKMILSIGWNPYYKNEKKSMETHIMNKFKEDFYGCQLKTIIVGYLRPMTDFNSVDELIKAIEGDVQKASTLLEKPSAIAFKNDNFFSAEVDC